MHQRARLGWWLLWAMVVASVAVASTSGPALARDDEREQRSSIRIADDSEFDADHGVRSGSGTKSDPYVISDWDVGSINISDTSRHVVIRDNIVRSRLTLNWNGPGVTVVGNKVGDLRVNQNVKRTGGPTSGVIARNEFGFVGQIRHFDGEFKHNTVDPRNRNGLFNLGDLPFFTNGPAVNFDGFNGAHFHHNTIYGPLRAQLHGHHHGSGYGEPSHHHGGSGKHGSHGMVDHTQRYHQVFITDNTIYSEEYYALMYTDVVHSANDRTAASEQNEELNKPHVHHTRVYLNDNKLVGAGLVIDVFNADDRRHVGTATGLVEIRGNKITVQDSDEPFAYEAAGIDVERARDLKLRIAGNRVVGVDDESPTSGLDQWDYDAGIRLRDIRAARVYLLDNVVANRDVGIEASRFERVRWWIGNLVTRDVDEDVSYDGSSNPPEEGP
ncbi:MAG: hypothetical protein ACRDKB_13380 [Actinomycetota bacterium]